MTGKMREIENELNLTETGREFLDSAKLLENDVDFDSVPKSEEEILMERVSEILGGTMVHILLDLVN